MVPIVLLVLVGFYVGIGSAFTNYILPEGTFLYKLFTMISNLGFWSPEPGFPLAELSPHADQAEWRKRPDLRGVPFVVSSDAHYLHEIPDASHTLSTAERTPQAVIDALEHLDGDV